MINMNGVFSRVKQFSYFHCNIRINGSNYLVLRYDSYDETIYSIMYNHGKEEIDYRIEMANCGYGLTWLSSLDYAIVIKTQCGYRLNMNIDFIKARGTLAEQKEIIGKIL